MECWKCGSCMIGDYETQYETIYECQVCGAIIDRVAHDDEDDDW